MSFTGKCYISVDIEASGPIPGEYSMLTLGACSANDPSHTFSCLIKPISDAFVEEAMQVTGLSLDELRATGLEPGAAMPNFADWVNGFAADRKNIVFVGLNAPFDWSFVNYYFHRFVGANPFGYAALDIKAYSMGAIGCCWSETRSEPMRALLEPALAGIHDALDDAVYQAELFRRVYDLAATRSARPT